MIHCTIMVSEPQMMMPDFTGGPVVFLKEVKSELSKVIWPSRDDVIRMTVIVIAVSVAVGLYIGGVDFILTKVTDLLIHR